MIHLKKVHLASLFVAAGDRPPLVLHLQVWGRFLGLDVISEFFNFLKSPDLWCVLYATPQDPLLRVKGLKKDQITNDLPPSCFLCVLFNVAKKHHQEMKAFELTLW